MDHIDRLRSSLASSSLVAESPSAVSAPSLCGSCAIKVVVADMVFRTFPWLQQPQAGKLRLMASHATNPGLLSLLFLYAHDIQHTCIGQINNFK